MRITIGWLCSLVLSVTAQGADILYFTSSPTSWVGQGETRWVTPADGFSFHGSHYEEGDRRDGITGGIRLHSNVPVPEPNTLVLAAAGLVGAAVYALGRWLGRRAGPN